MRLAFGHASRVVLIGCSAGDDARGAALARHLSTLRDLLADEMVWGLPRDNCIVLMDPVGPNEVDLALKSAGEGVGSGGLLLVYYAGPVLLGQDGALHLVLPGTEIRSLQDTAFPYEQLRWRVRENAARQRAVLLDCYDVAATGGSGSGRAMADAAPIDRTTVLVTAARPAEAQSPPFTAGLTALLTDGLPHGPNLLDLATVRRVLSERPGEVLFAEETEEPVPLTRNPALYRRDRIGQVLYAAEIAAETDLAGSVVLILRYDKDQGALGIVINRPGTEPAQPLSETWNGTLSEPRVVFGGGPVRHEGYIRLAWLHEGAKAPTRFQPVADRLGTIALSAVPSPAAVALFRLFRGYLGWGPGELEADVAGGVLVPTDAGPEVAFGEPAGLWLRLQAIG